MISALLLLTLAQAQPVSIVDPRNNTRRATFTDAGTRTGLDVYVIGQPPGSSGLTNTELRATPVPVGFDGGPVSITNTAVGAAVAVRCVDTTGSSFEACGGTGAAGLTDAELRASAVPVSAASLPLPTGAATEVTLSTRLAEATFTGRFPAAGALTDNYANPTTTSTAAHLMLWDGATWDRAPGTAADGLLVNLGANNDVTITSGSVTATLVAGGDVDVLTLPSVTIGTFPDNEPFNLAQANGVAVLMGAGATGTGSLRVTLATDTVAQATASALNAEVQGDAAHAAAVSGNPVLVGAYAEADAAALDSTGVADAEASRMKTDLEGRHLVRADHPNRWQCSVESATADTQCQATGAELFLTHALLSNGPTAQTIAIVSGTGAACATGRAVLIPAIYLGVNGGAQIPLPMPHKVTTSANVCCDISGSTAFSCRLAGYTAP